MTIEAEVARIAASHTDRNSALDALAALPGAVAYPTGFVRCQNLEMGVSSAGDDESAEPFRWLRSLDIAAAPELLIFPLCGGEYEVSVLRYWICPGERLIPVSGSKLKFTAAARDRFMRDMERLFEHGKMYPYIRGDAHWLVSENTGAIVLAPWLLKSAAPKDREEYFESIERTFARYT